MNVEDASNAFPVLRKGFSEGAYVRDMNYADVNHVCEVINRQQSFYDLVESMSPVNPPYSNFLVASKPEVDEEDSIYKHLPLGILGISELLVSVDLRLPRALLKRQFEELVDQHKRNRAKILPELLESRKPACNDWCRSRVLAYIDLTQWRDDLSDRDLKTAIKDVDIASALDITPKVLSEVTKQHGKHLTDDTSRVFVQLVETVISSRRGPLSPLRRVVRTKRVSKN